MKRYARARRQPIVIYALLAAALLHGVLIWHFRELARTKAILSAVKEDVISIYLQDVPQRPRKARPAKSAAKKMDKKVAVKPEPYKVITTAPTELPAVIPNGNGVEAFPRLAPDIGALDNVDFAPLFNPSPVYPEIARAAGITGYVLVELLIDENGFVLECKILEVVGHSQFVEETEKVIKTWRFPKPVVDGKPSRVRYVYRVIFRLD